MGGRCGASWLESVIRRWAIVRGWVEKFFLLGGEVRGREKSCAMFGGWTYT